MRLTGWRSFLLCGMTLAIVVLSDFGRVVAQGGTGDAPGGPNEITREYHKGALTLRFSIDRSSLSVAESLALTLEAEVEGGGEVEFPKIGEKLGDFSVKEHRDDPPRMAADGRTIFRRVYTLEPFLPGDYAIPPMQVRRRGKAVAGAQSGGDSQENEITTEEVSIWVNSLLEKDKKDVALNPIKEPVGLPPDPTPALYVMMGLGITALLAAVFLYFRRLRTAGRGRPEPVLAAHELAYRQLEGILGEKLIERGEIKLFFSKISDVLRVYIENRFGIHAQRQTTEELMSDASRGASFANAHGASLLEFLNSCDLVKFAGRRPHPDEIAKAVDVCKDFIEATKAQPHEEPRTKD